MNGGTCSNGLDKYRCRCAGGYKGINCETGKSDLHTVMLR